MTNKEIAQRLRMMVDNGHTLSSVRAFADELDPPLPEPGTVVWLQDVEKLSEPTLGEFNEYGCIEIFGSSKEIESHDVTWKPARFLAPDEVAVKVPPVSEWPRDAQEADLRWHYGIGTMSNYANVTITCTEAERMEAER